MHVAGLVDRLFERDDEGPSFRYPPEVSCWHWDPLGCQAFTPTRRAQCSTAVKRGRPFCYRHREAGPKVVVWVPQRLLAAPPPLDAIPPAPANTASARPTTMFVDGKLPPPRVRR